MSALAVTLACALGAGYNFQLSDTGKRAEDHAGWHRTVGNGAASVALSGNATGADHVCLAQSEFTLDPVEMHLMTEEGAAALPKDIDGVLGVADSRPGSVLGALVGRSSVPASKLRQHYHFALKLGQYLPHQKAYRDGSFQYEGVDTGAYEHPVWVAVAEEAKPHAHPSYGAVYMKSVKVYSMADPYVPAPAEAATESIDWEKAKMQELIGIDRLGLVSAAAPAVLLPQALVTQLGLELQTVWRIDLVIAKAGSKDGETVTVTIPPAALYSAEGMDVAAHESPQVVLGAPMFRAVNVAFLNNRHGFRESVGFAAPREGIAASEEFMGTPVHCFHNRSSIDIAVGGAWGDVQAGFHVSLDTTFSGLALQEGDFEGKVLRRPFVGSFKHMAGVLLLVLPVFISLVLWDAAKKLAATSPRPSPRSDEMLSPTKCSPKIKPASD
eukprot:TRINITY_DN17022_c0_g1_i1.p1 TRINITY_DN17022_c0_g1~~TRINITY_DN17022_c0_g1_i1.p1  ORF type:complete len:440 (+),score=118.26 TRINITY_DN17022_c0_g1_i1:55-1374(+)